MPSYGSIIPAQSLSTVPTTVWNAETPTPGSGGASASAQLGIAGSAIDRRGFAVDGKFASAPGAFEVDVQVAASDSDTKYQTIANGNVTSVDSVNNAFHLDAPNVIARYVRLLMRTRTNSVAVTAYITGA